jgi:hypothetical protein
MLIMRNEEYESPVEVTWKHVLAGAMPAPLPKKCQTFL